MTEQEQGKGGIGKWFACGCGCAILLLASIGGCFWVGVSQLRKSGGLPEVVETLSRHPEVQAQLGTPLTYSFLPMGNVQITNQTGTAEFSFTVTGPKGSADVEYSGVLENGVWEPTYLRLSLPDGTALVLVDTYTEELTPVGLDVGDAEEPAPDPVDAGVSDGDAVSDEETPVAEPVSPEPESEAVPEEEPASAA